MNSESIVGTIRGFLAEEGLTYEYDEAQECIRHVFTLECELKKVLVVWEVGETGYVVYTSAPVYVGQDNMDRLLRFVAMANYGLANGNFEVDCRDGEIRYKSYVNAESLEQIPRKIMQDSLNVGLFMMKRYGDGIAALVKGLSTAEGEIEKAESK